MYSYITKELVEIISKYFPVDKNRMSITGYSMGGHGALICGINSRIYKSISAIAPLCHPLVQERYGIKAYK